MRHQGILVEDAVSPIFHRLVVHVCIGCARLTTDCGQIKSKLVILACGKAGMTRAGTLHWSLSNGIPGAKLEQEGVVFFWRGVDGLVEPRLPAAPRCRARQSALRGGATRRTRAPRRQSFCNAILWSVPDARDHRRGHGGGDGKTKKWQTPKSCPRLVAQRHGCRGPIDVPPAPPTFISKRILLRPSGPRGRWPQSSSTLRRRPRRARDSRLEDAAALWPLFGISFELYAIRPQMWPDKRLSKSSK